MTDVTIQVVDGSVVVQPFGSDALVPLVGQAGQAVADAEEAAALSGQYANANTDADISGAAPGERGAKYWSTVASGHRVRAGNAVPFATWSALAAATGMSAGDKAQVLAADTGTHTDPVVGGTVNNAGVYTYSASPAGWQRTGDLDSQTAVAAVAATRQPFGVEIYNNGSAIAQGIYNGDYNATANYTVNRFTAIIEDATVGATAQISVLVDGVPTYGPVTVTFGTEFSAAPSFSIPSGADDAYLVENMTGTVRKIYIRGDGVAA